MDENEIKYEPQDEYHFTENPEAEVFSEQALTDSSKQSIFNRINRKTILIIIGVIVIALSLYKLISVFLADNKTSAEPTVPTQVQPVATPIPTTPTTNNQLASLQSNVNQNSAQVSALQNQVTTLANSVSTLQSSVATMNDQLQALTSTLQQVQAQLATAQAKPVYTAPQAPIVKKVIVRIKYYIQAIIPGRAWLVRPDGSTITIAVGDRLAGYGSITSINPTRGLVITSSGIIIRYRGS